MSNQIEKGYKGFLIEINPAATQEWTQAKLLEMYLADDSFESIADAINNGVDKVVADDAEIIVELEAKLDAEREKYLSEARSWFDRDKQLREQLNAERGKSERLATALRTIADMHHLPADVVAESALAEHEGK